MKKILIGAQEQLQLPDLGVSVIARIDTGAQTSALHVERLKADADARLVYFDLDTARKGDGDAADDYEFCVPMLAMRQVKSSNGTIERRPVIKTHLMMHQHRWNIELTLTNRGNMTFPMLLGRQAMGRRVLVSPGEQFLLTKPLTK